MMLYAFYLIFMISARQTNGEQCKVYQVAIYGKALHGHTYKIAKVGGLFTCYARCDRDPACKSCNFKHTKDSCEMNNETKEAKPNDFISDEQSYYIKRIGGDVDECAVFPNISGANADCLNTDGSYICNCKAGSTGDGKNCSRAGCPEGWKIHNHSCYFMTGETSSNLKDAKDKCKKMSATLPIIKSDSANNFILSVGEVWVWLGMARKNGKMVWFDNTPAERSEGALYNAWNDGEPSSGGNEDCAFLDFHTLKWADNKCYYGSGGPYVLCQKIP
ncbi:neurocan core protein-like [Acropora millepora]|uniref:neurocan core protein-like n=1 Tax=Acropora millepora TaxID=45264 RepID=UPI001CF4D36B|nr:neurocan core protein-like [Acropora millepora]